MCLLIDHFLNTILKLFFIIIDVHQDQSINFTKFIIFHLINLKVKRKYEVNNTFYWEAVLLKDKSSPNYVFGIGIFCLSPISLIDSPTCLLFLE